MRLKHHAMRAPPKTLASVAHPAETGRPPPEICVLPEVAGALEAVEGVLDLVAVAAEVDGDD
jgi:hypothetical protein